MQDNSTRPLILIMAGGTGGHVMPALTVAQALLAKGYRVHWLGTRQGLEATLVPQQGIPMTYLPIQGLRGQSYLRWVIAPWKLLYALGRCWQLIRMQRPITVLSMGGYCAGPGGVAAWLTRTRLLVHEQNAIAGFTNRCLAPLAQTLMTAYPNAFPQKYQHKIMQLGNPVRPEIVPSIPAPSARPSTLKLLVLGGSLGAPIFNQQVPLALAQMPVALRSKIEVWHQTGRRHWVITQQNYQPLQLSSVKIVAFIEVMAQAYAWADVILCRAGALTVAEIMAAGKASILVPFPLAMDDHQTKNAQFLSEQGAAWLVPQAQLSAQYLATYLQKLIHQPELYQAIAANCRALAPNNATKSVTELCIEV